MFNTIARSTCCNVSLNILITRQKYRMANILNSRAFFLQIWQQQKAKAEAFGSRILKLQSIDGLFELRKVKGSNIVKCAQKKHFTYIIDKNVSLRRHFSKALVILFWFLLLLFLLFLLIVYISLAFHLQFFQSELFRIFIV